MPPPQANEDQHKSPPDMSHKTAPKQILQRKQISQQEYDLRKEWAPETVSDYQVQLQPKPKQGEWQFHDFEKSQLQPQPQRHQHAATVAVPSANANANTNANNKVPGRVPNRRSALFEEWKAKSLRSPEQVKEARAVQKDNCTGNRRINTSGDVRLALGERFDKAGSGPARNKPRNNSRSQQAGSIDTKSNAVSGGARKPLVEHTAEASNLPKTESASKVPTQLPELNSTQDITASGNTEKALKEPSNGTADTGMKAEAAKTGPIQQPETQANVKAQTETKSAEKDSTQQPEAQVQENSPPKSTVESLGGSSKVADTQTKIEPANRDLSQNPEKNNTEDKITRDVGQTLPGESGASLAEFSGETSDSQTKTKSENDGCMPQTAVTKVEDAAMSKGTSNSGSKQQPEDNKAGSVTEGKCASTYASWSILRGNQCAHKCPHSQAASKH
ncbi:hypothetical protein BDW74DRAFT_148440 [Aspergillus multicolor]|uniref:uncharacterized protein n=1 Tax=Aspergillus multicolor TaxID=41759 RepID=UPI003CCDB8BA